MNLGRVGVIARKELVDVLRDRRTLIFMMLLPVVVMPLLMIGVSKFVWRQSKAKEAEPVKVVAQGPTRTTIEALARDWKHSNFATLAVIYAKFMNDTARNLEDVDRLVQRVQVLKQKSQEDSLDDALAGAGLKALLELPPEETALIDDAKAIINFVSRTRWVRFDELVEEGDLARGIEIPEGTPEVLADPRVAVAIQNKQIEAAIHLARDALVTLEDGDRAVDMHALYDSSQSMSEEAYKRLRAFVAAINRHTLQLRLREAHLPTDFTTPMQLEDANIATASRQVQAVLGGLLPYLLFAFCFFGALYPALDVTAGEKERFTLETLLLAPISRFEIAVGKFLVVFVAAITAALLTTTSMAVTFTHGILPDDVLATLDIEFQPLAVLLTASLVLPVAAMYSAALLAVGLYARSFKEAQSYTVPLQFLFVLPTLASLLPDLQAEPHLAWIPFVNISMLMRELLKGNYLWSFYGITLASTLLLTLITLLLASRLFRREGVLLRT